MKKGPISRRKFNIMTGTAVVGAPLLGGIAAGSCQTSGAVSDEKSGNTEPINYQTDAPNIILVTSDQEHEPRWFGDTNLERYLPARSWLKKAGVHFTEAHAVTLPCSPSRCSIYTALHPYEHQLYGNVGGRGEIALHDFPTIARVLKHGKHEYQTVYIGKSHLAQMGGYPCAAEEQSQAEGDNGPRGKEHGMAPFGFDWWKGAHENGPTLTKWADGNEPTKELKTVADHLGDQVTVEWPERASSCYDSPGIFNEAGREDVHFALQAGRWLGKFTESPHEGAQRLENGIDPARPFFTVLSLVDPHDIAMFPRWARRFIDDKGAQIPSYGAGKVNLETLWPNPAWLSAPPQKAAANYEPLDILKKYKPSCQSEYQQNLSGSTMGPMANDYDDKLPSFKLWDEMVRYYLQLMMNSDFKMSYILWHIFRLPKPVRDNLVLVFTSDHGDKLGAHSQRGKGCSLYEEETNVPLYVVDFSHPNVVAAIEKMEADGVLNERGDRQDVNPITGRPDDAQFHEREFHEALRSYFPESGSRGDLEDRDPSRFFVKETGGVRTNLVDHFDMTTTIGAIAHGSSNWKAEYKEKIDEDLSQSDYTGFADRLAEGHGTSVYIGAAHMRGKDLTTLLNESDKESDRFFGAEREDDYWKSKSSDRLLKGSAVAKSTAEFLEKNPTTVWRRELLSTSSWNWGLGDRGPEVSSGDLIREPYRIVGLRQQLLDDDGEVVRDYKLNLYYRWEDYKTALERGTEYYKPNGHQNGPYVDWDNPEQVELYDMLGTEPELLEMNNLLPFDYPTRKDDSDPWDLMPQVPAGQQKRWIIRDESTGENVEGDVFSEPDKNYYRDLYDEMSKTLIALAKKQLGSKFHEVNGQEHPLEAVRRKAWQQWSQNAVDIKCGEPSDEFGGGGTVPLTCA